MTDREGLTFEFVCDDCRRDIISLGYHDGVPVCQVCRFIREYIPNMSDDMKAKLRGEDECGSN